MSTFTKTLTSVNDAALAAATSAYNASRPVTDPPTPELTPHQYLSTVLDTVLKSYQDQYIRITSGAFLLRFPPGRIDTIRAAAANNAQLNAYIAEVEANPFVYIGSTLVRNGIAFLVANGLLTQAEADVILA